MLERNEIEAKIGTFVHHEQSRLLRDWIELEFDRLHKLLASPKHGEIETASMRGEYKQLKRLLNLLEDRHEPI